MIRLSVLVPIMAVAGSAALAAAQPLLVPLEQVRYLAITLHAQSGETVSEYVLSSEPEAFEPFYAGINGELIVETAVSAGVGGHLAEIHDNGFLIAQTCTASATTRGALDSAFTQTDATFMVRFDVPQASTFEIFGYAESAANTKSTLNLAITRPDGSRVWGLQSERADGGYTGAGMLEAGEYQLAAINIARVEIGALDYQRAQTSLVVSFHLGPTKGCPCDWNGDTFLDTADLFSFLSDFFALQADFNGSGETDSADFFAFMVCLLAGCAP